MTEGSVSLIYLGAYLKAEARSGMEKAILVPVLVASGVVSVWTVVSDG